MEVMLNLNTSLPSSATLPQHSTSLALSTTNVANVHSLSDKPSKKADKMFGKSKGYSLSGMGNFHKIQDKTIKKTPKKSGVVRKLGIHTIAGFTSASAGPKRDEQIVCSSAVETNTCIES